MLHEIKIKKDYSDSSMESDLVKKISKERFFGEMQDYNIDMNYLLKNSKTDLNYLAKFNYFLVVVKQNHQIGVYESILILEEEEYGLKKLINLLSSEMRSVLEKELIEKYKFKKTDHAIIDNFFIF